MSEQKYFYVRVTTTDGEREYTQHYIQPTKCKNPGFAAEWFAAHFFGYGSLEKKSGYYTLKGARTHAWSFDCGEVMTRVDTWREITQEEYFRIFDILYCS
jgi:hypothetical protein